jgi:hypothetical protein
MSVFIHKNVAKSVATAVATFASKGQDVR